METYENDENEVTFQKLDDDELRIVHDALQMMIQQEESKTKVLCGKIQSEILRRSRLL